jgi:taurine transport system substrate-binding protein
VDLLFTADQPALTLASRAPQWGIIGRLMTNRVGMLVPPDSPVTRPAELKGRRLALPFGAAAQREALAALRADGQDPATVETVNLGLPEIQGLVAVGASAGRWGETDAVAVWDPTLSDLELQGRARLLSEARVTSLILLNDGYAAEHPGSAERLLEAIGQAWRIYAQDPAAADAAFLKATALSLHPEALTRAASAEPNLRGSPRLQLNEAEIAGLESAARFMHEVGLLAAPLDLGAALRPSARQR